MRHLAAWAVISTGPCGFKFHHSPVVAPNNGVQNGQNMTATYDACQTQAAASAQPYYAAAASHMPDGWTAGGRIIVGGIIVGAIRGASGGWPGAAVGAGWGAIAGFATSYGPSILAQTVGVAVQTSGSLSCMGSAGIIQPQ